MQKGLEEGGWNVHPQVGIAGFRIDLGIVHPDAPGRYLAGVECDGASYHRSATARDRDLLRERVLRGLGWRIHRVWSTDWWVDTETAIARLTAAMQADLRNDREEAEAAAATQGTRRASGLEMSDPEVDMIEPAADAEPDQRLSREEGATLRARTESHSPAAPIDVRTDQASFGMAMSVADDLLEAKLGRADRDTGLGEDHPRPADYVVFIGTAGPDPRTALPEVLADSLCQIIEVEGPMLAKRVYDIYLRGCGIRRLGGELRTALNRALARAVKDGRVISENEPGVTGLIHSTVRLHSGAPVWLRVRGPRNFEEIPPTEPCAAAKHVFQLGRMTWGSDEHLRAVLELFDLKRLTTQVGTRLLQILGLSNGSSIAPPSKETYIDGQPQ